ncbi:MAG: hypothetical protein ACK2UH_18475, partial [Candidatus Promineifilaceae bacterium]
AYKRKSLTSKVRLLASDPIGCQRIQAFRPPSRQLSKKSGFLNSRPGVIHKYKSLTSLSA